MGAGAGPDFPKKNRMFSEHVQGVGSEVATARLLFAASQSNLRAFFEVFRV